MDNEKLNGELYKITMDNVAVSCMRQMSTADIVSSFTEKKSTQVKRSFFRKPVVIVVVILVLALGAGTVFAAVNNFWGWKIGRTLGTDEAGLEDLKEKGLANSLTEEGRNTGATTGADLNKDREALSALAVTSNGITVTPIAVVNDGYYAVVTFGITGNNADELDELLFGRHEFKIDDFDHVSMSGSQIEGENGEHEFEMIFSINGSLPDNLLDGKNIHITLTDITYWRKFENERTVLEGTWTFDFNLGGRHAGKKFELGTELDGMGFAVESIEWNPLSVYVIYSPDVVNVEAAHDEVPFLASITTTDGQTLGIGATGGFYDETREKAFAFGGGRLLVDPSEVELLNFQQLESESADGCTYRYCSIPLNK